jgi:hypothetical protein
VDGSGVDVTLIGTYGVSIKEALALIAVTTPCVIVGIAARRGAAARRARAPRRAAAAREAGQAEGTPSP